MKKQISLLIISVILVAIGAVIFVTLQKRRAHSLFHQLPASKPHQHVSPDGKIVEHRHIYETPTVHKTNKGETNQADTAETNVDTPKPKKKTRIQIAWEKLDLESIKRDWQPYTVSEMNELWWYEEMVMPNGVNYEKNMEWIDRIYPRDEWLQRYMDLGYPFRIGSHYRTALNGRIALERYREQFNRTDPRPQPDSYPTWRAEVLNNLDLPPETTWKEFEDAFIKWNVVTENAFERASQADPSFIGGTSTIDGVVTSFKKDTVSVYISEMTGYSRVTGARLTREERDTLTMYGVSPKGMQVVYVDENGNPLPADAPVPRFYEKRMKRLEKAEKQVEKMIVDHEALFKSLPEVLQEAGSLKTDLAPSETSQHKHEHPHWHPPDAPNAHENAQPPRGTKPERELPHEMLPNEPPSPHNIQHWFEVLQELHGGDLPKDLRKLQKIVMELDAIRKEGEKKSSKPSHRPPEHSAPKPHTSPESPNEQ